MILELALIYSGQHALRDTWYLLCIIKLSQSSSPAFFSFSFSIPYPFLSYHELSYTNRNVLEQIITCSGGAWTVPERFTTTTIIVHTVRRIRHLYPVHTGLRSPFHTSPL